MRVKALVLCCATMLVAASAAQAAVLFTDNFESGLGAWTANTGGITGSYVWGTPYTAVAPVGSNGQSFIHAKFLAAPSNFTYQIFHPISTNAAATQVKLTVDVYTAGASVRSYAGFQNYSGTALTTTGPTLARIGMPSSSAYREEYYTTALQTAVGATSTNAWHTATVTFDKAAKTVAFTWDGASYGPFANANISAMPQCIQLGYNSGSSNDVYWDNVKVEQFAPAAGKATTPAPSNNDITVLPSLSQLTWAAGANTSSYDVYFGSGSLALMGNQTGTSFGLPSLLPNTMYSWRIDSKNAVGDVTTGDLWSFTTTPEPVTVVLLAMSGLLVVGRRRHA